MKIKYDADIQREAVESNLKRLLNQTYKLLPNREENHDWQKPLTTILEEFAGMDRLFLGQHEIFFSLLSKLEGLFTLEKEEDFFVYRKTIFECLGLINGLIAYVRS
jgi:hypothetical protein